MQVRSHNGGLKPAGRLNAADRVKAIGFEFDPYMLFYDNLKLLKENKQAQLQVIWL